MQTTTYGSTQPKTKQTINTSAYTAPAAPLSTLYSASTPKYADRASSILGLGGQAGGVQVGGKTTTLPYLMQGGGTIKPPTGTGGSSAAPPIAGPSSTIGAGPGFTPPNINDLTLDPVYQQVVAAGGRNVADANAAALAQAKNAIIGYGSIAPDAAKNLASLFQADPNNPILGALSDTLTAQAAAANPNATLNQLSLNDQQRLGTLDNDLNNQNLYYSSTRAGQLANDANTYRNEQAQATGALGDTLSGIYGNVLNAQQQALEDQNNALQQAYQNSLTIAEAGGGAPDQSPGGAVPNNGPAGPTSVNAGGGNTTVPQPTPQQAASIAGLGGQLGGVQVGGQTTTIPYVTSPLRRLMAGQVAAPGAAYAL